MIERHIIETMPFQLARWEPANGTLRLTETDFQDRGDTLLCVATWVAGKPLNTQCFATRHYDEAVYTFCCHAEARGLHFALFIYPQGMLSEDTRLARQHMSEFHAKVQQNQKALKRKW